MRVVALTGGIATGKSTVARLLSGLGIDVLDADVLAHQVLEHDPGHTAVVREFGPEILDAEGKIDRRRLGKEVFADPEKRRRLEAITHPLVRQLLQEALRQKEEAGAGLVIADLPLLFESQLQESFPQSLLVYTPAELQLQRLIQRDGLSRIEAEQRLAAQLPIAEKRGLATWEIDNSGTEADTEAQVRAWLELLGHGAVTK